MIGVFLPAPTLSKEFFASLESTPKISAATIAAFYLETEISSWLAYYNIYSFASLSLLIFSVVEEVLKFLVVWFFISGSRFFDEPVDYMIYMVTAALGLPP